MDDKTKERLIELRDTVRQKSQRARKAAQKVDWDKIQHTRPQNYVAKQKNSAEKNYKVIN